MIELRVKSGFAAAHYLNGYEGDCKDLHGHNFGITVVVKIEKLDELGMGKDFRELKNVVEFYVKQFDHKNLNDLDPFKDKNPTSENIAIWLFNNISTKINSEDIAVYSVCVEECDKYSATYIGDSSR